MCVREGDWWRSGSNCQPRSCQQLIERWSDSNQARLAFQVSRRQATISTPCHCALHATVWWYPYLAVTGASAVRPHHRSYTPSLHRSDGGVSPLTSSRVRTRSAVHLQYKCAAVVASRSCVSPSGTADRWPTDRVSLDCIYGIILPRCCRAAGRATLSRPLPVLQGVPRVHAASKTVGSPRLTSPVVRRCGDKCDRTCVRRCRSRGKNGGCADRAMLRGSVTPPELLNISMGFAVPSSRNHYHIVSNLSRPSRRHD